MDKYVISVGDKELEIEKAATDILDVSNIADSKFHLLRDNKAFWVKLIQADYDKKMLRLEVNGNSYAVKISDRDDQMVAKMGLLVGNSQKAKDIKAPMPGLIIDIMVTKGEEITEGTPLIVLSAMKMENILLAQADGVIQAITVNKGDTVDKGQLIIEIN